MKEGCIRGCHRRTSEDHAGLHGLQAPQLHHQEEPAQRPRPARAQEVLPELPHAHRAPRDSLTARCCRLPDVPLDASLVGRAYPASAPYEVGREKVRELAEALGDRNPVYTDGEAAAVLGYQDVIAPPTFAFVVAWRGLAPL